MDSDWVAESVDLDIDCFQSAIYQGPAGQMLKKIFFYRKMLNGECRLFIHLTRPHSYKAFSCSTQMSMKFILFINVKMPTIVGILTFISWINTA